MNLDALKQSRSLIKGAITRLETWFLANKDSLSDIIELETRLDKLHSSFNNYERVQDEIEILLTEENSDSENRAAVEN